MNIRRELNRFGNVFKSFLSIIVGEGISLALNLVIVAFSARLLGVEQFGSFSFMLAIIAMISGLINLGLGPILFREYSKNLSKSSLLLDSILIRLFLFVLLIILLHLTSIFFDFQGLDVLLLTVLSLNIIFSARMSNVREILTVPFKVTHRMMLPMMFKIFDLLILLLLLWIVSKNSLEIDLYIIIFTFSNLLGFVSLLIIFFRNITDKYNFNIKRIKWLLKQSIPIAGFLIFIGIFQQIEIFFLNLFDSEYATGIYSAAYRLTTPLYIFPLAFVTTLFPIIVRNFDSNKTNKDVFLLANKALLLISLSITLITVSKSNEIIDLIYGESYLPSSVSLNWLILSQIFLFFNYFYLDVFTATNHQKLVLYYSIILVLVSIIFNIILIPELSYIGAALSKLSVTLIGFIFVLVAAQKIKIQFLFHSLRFYLVPVIMIIFALILKQIEGLFLFILISAIVYSLIVILSKYFTKYELSFINNFKKFGHEE